MHGKYDEYYLDFFSLNTYMRQFPAQQHIPVLLDSCLSYLPTPKTPQIYCDATFGNGGYTKALLGIQL